MKKASILFILAMYVLLPLAAQNTIRITGVVLDKDDNNPVEYAGVKLLKAKDSTFVSGGATDDKGKFLISANPGRYILNISYVGYKPSYTPVDARQKSVDIGQVLLSPDGVMLSEAVVTAKAVEIAIKGDTVEYNADSYKVQQSAVVEDLLKKMPGAEVSSDGKITINGKEVKKILVDGKEFFSDDPKVASKNLPAAMVDKLQVLDRKSDMAQMTGFDDGNDETVINLTIKKGMKQGLYGSSTAGLGTDNRYGLSAIGNYMHDNNQFTLMGGSNNTNNEGFTDNVGNTFRGFRPRGMSFGGNNGITKSSSGGFNFALNPSDKLKWGGNIRAGRTENDVETSKRIEYTRKDDPKGNQVEERYSKGQNISDNVSASFRFEWTPDSLTKVIFSPNLQYGKNGVWSMEDFTTSYPLASDTLNRGISNSSSEGKRKAGNAQLDVSRTLGKKGRVLSFSLSGGYNKLDNDGSTWSKTNTGTDVKLIDLQTHQDNSGYNWRAYTSYVEPVGNNNFVQLNYSYRKNYSVADQTGFQNDGLGNHTVIDTLTTKNLKNDFVNQEVGLNFKSVRAKYNYTVGVMLQSSTTDNFVITPKQSEPISNYVLNFAPVAQFNYLWSKQKNLRLDYSATTTQPTTTQLSSVRDETDPLNVSYGNPNLKPTFNNRLRVRYQNFNPEKASTFMVFGGVDFATNDIVSRNYQLSGGKRESTFDNVNGNWTARTRVIVNQPLKRNKKFSVSSMTFASYGQSNGFIELQKNTANNLTLTEYLGLQYRSDLFDFGVRGNVTYNGTRNTLGTNNDRDVYNYGGTFNTTVYLPQNWTIDTDMTYSSNSGFSQGFQLNEWLWNASISKQIFKAKNGTLKLSGYDILGQRTNISQTFNDQFNSETLTNVLGRYFMFSFIYRFQIFKGGAKMSDMQSESDHPRMGPPPGGGGGRPVKVF